MLDYILSRLVLISFLLLLVGLLMAYQGFLGKFLLVGAAKALARNVGEKVRTVAVSIATAQEEKIIKLAPYLSTGPIRTNYYLRILCKREGSGAYLAFAVLDRKKNVIYVYPLTINVPGKEVRVWVPRDPIPSGHSLKIERITYSRSVELKVMECEGSCSTVKETEECG